MNKVFYTGKPLNFTKFLYRSKVFFLKIFPSDNKERFFIWKGQQSVYFDSELRFFTPVNRLLLLIFSIGHTVFAKKIFPSDSKERFFIWKGGQSVYFDSELGFLHR